MVISMKQNKQVALSKNRKRFYDKCVVKAQKILPSKERISKAIKKGRKIVEHLKNVPRCDTLCKNICCFCDLITDYLDGIYPHLPLSTMGMLLAGLLWFIIPFDPIPDFFLLIGWADDIAVIVGIAATAQKDINDYLAWKNNQIVDAEKIPLTE